VSRPTLILRYSRSIFPKVLAHRNRIGNPRLDHCLESILPARRGHMGEELGTRRESVQARRPPAKSEFEAKLQTSSSNVKPNNAATKWSELKQKPAA
jgi:hypothetical protein